MNFRQGRWYDETKYVVTHSKLMELLEVCELCAGFCNVEANYRDGAYVKFTAICTSSDCRHAREWETSAKIAKRPVINLILSAVILFSGCLPRKILKMLALISVMVPTPAAFFNHQRDFLHGVSNTYMQCNV